MKRNGVPRREHHLICPKCGKELDRTECALNREAYCEVKENENEETEI